MARTAPPPTRALPNGTIGPAEPPVNGSVCERPARIIVVTCDVVLAGATVVDVRVLLDVLVGPDTVVDLDVAAVSIFGHHVT